MSESTEVTKKRKRESPMIHGVSAEIYPGGGQVGQRRHFVCHFKLLTISVPFKIILHWANICFSEHDYFRAEKVEFSTNYTFCEWYIKYIILSKYEQNTHFIQTAFCLRAFPLLWNVASAREWDFTAQQFWWSWVFAPLRRNIADEAMQIDVHKTLYPF